MTGFARARAAMVERQLAARGIADPAILAAVPRERFVPVEHVAEAYDDTPGGDRSRNAGDVRPAC
jgi:protein-L-isoaspartate(D-aspartate) O-methyltransferase